MKIGKWYINFSKLLVSSLILVFFALLIFDGYAVIRMMNMIDRGVDLSCAAVIGTVISVMSTFADGVVLFAVRNYLEKSRAENVVGYDSYSGTIADERIKLGLSGMDDPAGI